MLFRCDCCGVESWLPSEQEVPMQLHGSDEQLCPSCLTLVCEVGRPLLAAAPAWALPLVTHSFVALLV
jgi:hypothetical protein